MTIHNLINKLTNDLNLTPEQQFKLTADIKRYTHYQKESVYYRYSMYAQNRLDKFFFLTWKRFINRCKSTWKYFKTGSTDHEQWIHEILSSAAKNHEHWANLPDEEIVTWDVGSHKYVQKRN